MRGSGRKVGNKPPAQRWVLGGKRVGEGRGRAAEVYSRCLHHVRKGRGAGLSHHKGCYRSAEWRNAFASPAARNRLFGFRETRLNNWQ